MNQALKRHQTRQKRHTNTKKTHAVAAATEAVVVATEQLQRTWRARVTANLTGKQAAQQAALRRRAFFQSTGRPNAAHREGERERSRKAVWEHQTL